MPAFNIRKDKNAWVSMPVTVPEGTVVGQVVPVGTGGLTGIALTNIAVGPDDTNLVDYDAPGLAVGQATCTLLGVSLVAYLAIGTAITQYNPVYIKTDGTYTAAANNGSGTNYQFIGYFLDATLGAAGSGRVALHG